MVRRAAGVQAVAEGRGEYPRHLWDAGMEEPSGTIGRAIAVFAHNEERHIIACLESVHALARDDDRCFVLCNGSRDRTRDLVASFARNYTFCNLIEIEVGDKANAWNVFCHELGIDAGMYIFMDGDCRAGPDAFEALAACLESQDRVNAAAGLPDRGCSRGEREAMLTEGGLAGGLYALSRGFVDRVRKLGVRLPVGLIGDDSLIGTLAYWDLEPRNEWDKSRIACCEAASFHFDRLSLLSVQDARLYLRRKVRYSLRYFQNQMLRSRLKAWGLAGIPEHVRQLYAEAPSELTVLKWRGLDTLFDYLALRRIRALGRSVSGS